MSKKITMSLQTRANWLIDLTVLLGGLLASLSGIYFLFLPSGGYQGARNPMYGITILFNRRTWEDQHTWTGVAMIAAAAVHLAIHWQWVKTMTRRIDNAITAKDQVCLAAPRSTSSLMRRWRSAFCWRPSRASTFSSGRRKARASVPRSCSTAPPGI